MSYYDDCDDQYSSDEDIFYHNYSVDYANQILSGYHNVSSCLPRTRRKHRQYSPRLVRVSTLDEIPIVPRHNIYPSLHSRPKYATHDDENIISSQEIIPTRLPSLEATSQEIERRAKRVIQDTPNPVVAPIDNINSSQENSYRPLNEAELRQVQQQQQAFQQHLMNMQRHLMEQEQQQQQEPQQPQQQFQQNQTTNRFKTRIKKTYHDIEQDDDQAEIAQLIEEDPYFAAAMEDFANTHGLIQRRRTESSNTSSSRHINEHHRPQYQKRKFSRQRTPSTISSSSSSSFTNVTPEPHHRNRGEILYRELHDIRRLIEQYCMTRNMTQPTIQVLPVPWPTNLTQIPTTNPVHYPTVPPSVDYEPARVPPIQPSPPNPTKAIYQNVVNAVKEVIERRSPSQQDQPLKPSQIDPKLKHVYTRRPQIRPSNGKSQVINRPPLPPSQQTGRRSSQTTLPIISSPSTNIPPAPPYEPLMNFSSSRPITNQNRHLSYGNQEKHSNIYDTLQAGHYLRLNTNKFH